MALQIVARTLHLEMVTSAAGLIVPESAIPKPQSLSFLPDDLRKVRRAIKALRGYKMGVVLVCMECDSIVAQHQGINARDQDITVLRCRHAEREVVGTL